MLMVFTGMGIQPDDFAPAREYPYRIGDSAPEGISPHTQTLLQGGGFPAGMPAMSPKGVDCQAVRLTPLGRAP